MDRLFTKIATRISIAVGQPQAFVAAVLAILLWGLSGPVFHYSDTWQLIVNTGTSIATLLMVFLIQNSQNRDAAAMQAKLDELLRAVEAARHQFIGIEHLSDQQIQEIRAALERDVSSDTEEDGSPDDSVQQLLDRLR